MKFKVGDWVRISGTVQRVIDINPPTDYDQFFDIDMIETEDDYVSAEVVELWQPKEGEYVWFWKMHNKELLYMFGKFSHHNQFGYIIDEDENGAIISSKLRYWDNCDPFIGKLPSFIKEIK